MRKAAIFILISLFFAAELFPQVKILTNVSEKKYRFSEIFDSTYGIDIYEKLNFTNSDSIRNDKKGYAAQGWIEDYYESGKLLHKGYYVDGHLKVYKNYYENGQEERSFRSISIKKCNMQIFYPDGKLKSNVDFLEGAAQKWEDYYPNGQLEFVEEFDNGIEYVIRRNFYAEDGKPVSTMELFDPKKKRYIKKEYFESGKIKEEGEMRYNPAVVDYQKDGKWKVYDESGNVVSEQKFSDGDVVGD